MAKLDYTAKFEYEIILLKDNVEVLFVKAYKKRENAIKFFKERIEGNRKKIDFPVRFLNSHGIREVNYALAIIQRTKEDESAVTKLKNNMGEYVDHVIEDNNQWKLIEKEEFNFEESFWVYGKHPRNERMFYKDIYANYIKKYAVNKDEFLNVMLYKNKIVIESLSHTDMIICKNKDDSIRFYTRIQSDAYSDKLKYIMFSGDVARTRDGASKIIKKIQALTGWNVKKCIRSSTRP